MKPILFYKAGELTPKGDPIMIHFAPGVTIEPNERAPETKTLITVNGVRHSIKGNFKDVLKLAGYENLDELPDAEKPVTTATAEDEKPREQRNFGRPGRPSHQPTSQQTEL